MRPAGWCDEPAGFFLSVGRPSRKDRTCPATASATFIPRASRPRSLRALLPQVHIARWSWASRPQHRKTRRRPAGPQVQHPRRTPRCRSRRCAGLAGTFHGSLWLPSSSGHPPCQRGCSRCFAGRRWHPARRRWAHPTIGDSGRRHRARPILLRARAVEGEGRHPGPGDRVGGKQQAPEETSTNLAVLFAAGQEDVIQPSRVICLTISIRRQR
jgi:hypothetical protein